MADGRMLQERVFHLARGKRWHFVALAVSLGGFLMIAIRRAIDTGQVSAATMVPFIVLVPLALVAFRGHWDRRPVLRISPEGIWYAGWKSAVPLEWDRVLAVEEVALGPGDPFIALVTIADRGRAKDQMPRNSFRVSHLDAKHKDVVKVIRQYCCASRHGGPELDGGSDERDEA